MTVIKNASRCAATHRPLSWAGQRIADETVVTRKLDGSVASLFRDDLWRLDAYDKNGPNRALNFRDLVSRDCDAVLAAASRIQVKQVMYFIMHEVPEDMPAVSTLNAKLVSIRGFSLFASQLGRTLYEGMQDAGTIIAYVRTKCRPTKVMELHTVLLNLNHFGKDKIGVEIPLREIHGPMRERHEERSEARQHAVIPTRIYQNFLSRCEVELGMAEATSDELVQMMRQVYAGNSLPEVAPPALGVFLKHVGRTWNIGNLAGAVSDIRVLCEVLIVAFTGMRSKEGVNLPFNCVTVFREEGVEHYAIKGVTTKLNNGRVRRACWVTSRMAIRAARLAQKIFGEVHAKFGKPEYVSSTDDTYLLFCPTGLFTGGYQPGRSLSLQSYYIESFRNRVFLSINQEDVAELKNIDPFRAWEDEPEYAVGMRWPFTKHQLRRTLALYAQRSGLVTLPTLKRQLQHITMEMTMYYARGSAFAKDVMATSDDHFAKEWQAAQGLSQYLAYAATVLFSDERLFGGHGIWAGSEAVQLSPVSVHSRERTLEMFQRGQLAYKETALGGCASTGPCRSSPLDWFPRNCLEKNCKDMILVPSRLRLAIKAQERLVEELERAGEESVEYQIEKDVLTMLQAAETRLRA